MRKNSKDYKKGYANALRRGEPIPFKSSEVVQYLETENITKARRALECEYFPPRVKAYWFGYLTALVRN